MHRKLKIAGITFASLLLFVGVPTTLAYMTDAEQATNTFTVGKVTIDLTEPDYPGNDTDETKGLLSGQEVPKNPTVTNTGANDAVVFLKVTVPVENAKHAKDDYETKAQEVFYLKTDENDDTVYENSFDENWIELTEYEEGTDYTRSTRTYVFGYKTKVEPEKSTTALFDKVQVRGLYWDESVSGQKEKITFDAYAIQADDVINKVGDVFNTKAEMSKDDLIEIYQIYVNQSGH